MMDGILAIIVDATYVGLMKCQKMIQKNALIAQEKNVLMQMSFDNTKDRVISEFVFWSIVSSATHNAKLSSIFTTDTLNAVNGSGNNQVIS